MTEANVTLKQNLAMGRNLGENKKLIKRPTN
jgi:hypothetical protein